ncbi:MAG: ABC transporter ATP-binding protein/permease [Lachnospiraceae bacterium]|nr:ABC transporter ATP-binding protein/permease [Lachnospiraceae bacterium]
MKEMLTLRQVLAQQWYLTKLCCRKAPGFMALHLFESIEIQVSIFVEFTWMVNYILTAAEQGKGFNKILIGIGIVMVWFALATLPYGIYNHYALPKNKQVLYQALRMEIYDKAKEVDLSCYDDKDFYETFILATAETDRCIDRYLEFVHDVTGYLAGALCALFYCAYINPAALLVMVAMLPLELFCVAQENKRTVSARMERVSHEQKREYENRVFYLSDYAGDLRLYPQMKKKCGIDYTEANYRIQSVNRKYGKLLFRYGLFHEAILSRVVKEGVIWTILLYQMLVRQTLSGAHLVTSRSCIRRISVNMARMIYGYRLAVENSAYVYRIREFLQTEPTIISNENEVVPKGVGGLSVKHVNFSYLSGKPVLKNVTFAVKPGQKVALVGYNGSGKTTLVKLLLRLYDPSAGRICYHGKDIREYQIMAYRRSIGSVFQDFKIYAATLKENVLMDVEDGSREENYLVEKALYDAHFTLEDNRLTYQIETPLTTEFEKDGVNLSGGEAQKVAIARTLYRKQDMIIMDEPSSALDPLAEYRLNQELNEIAKDKTVIFISHRLSTVRDADCIYMMENGEIVESGTHEELLAENGKYADMWKIQAGLYADVC